MSNLEYENDLLSKGKKHIAGVDEVGRGPLAGPVTIGIVIPDLKNIIEGINDSKKLTDKKRRLLYPIIKENCIGYKTVSLTPEEIDKYNILEATKLAMVRAINEVEPNPDIVLIDAVKLEVDVPTLSIIQGDAKSYCIGMASILAKVERDNMMIEYAKMYPEYGFDVNKGYGTKQHIDALIKYGPCPIHRKSFIKNFLDRIEGNKYAL